jgi:DNA-binding SARP family transcriptional activator/predicted negative regulator of RcsB-dependent stress response
MSGKVTVDLLGRFSVTAGGTEIRGDAWRSRRAAHLVKLLALAPGHRLHRERVMEALWPGSDSDASAATLRKAIHFARRAIDDDTAIINEGGVLVLWPGAEVTPDVEAFERAAEGAIASKDRRACATAAALYTGELLPDDRYESWTAEPRERLRRRLLDVLRSGALWERLAEEDPTDEEAARTLMRAHLDDGERREAIRRFERLREALRDQLGVGPDPNTVSLYEEVLAMEGDEPPTIAERAHALLSWALVHWSRKEVDEAERAATEARALAMEGDLGRELGEAATVLALVAMSRGRWRERFTEEFAASIRMRANMEPIVYDAHLCFAEYYLTGPDGYDAAAAFARELLGIAEAAGSRTGAALALLMLGEADLLAGRLDEAEGHLRIAAEANEREGCISGCALATQRLAEGALARGRRWEAGRLLGRARTLAMRSDIVSHLLVRVFGTMIEAAADPAKAVAVLRDAQRELAQMRACEPCSMGFHLSAAAASARAGDLEAARRHVGEAERISVMWQGGPWTAGVWEVRGVIRLADGDAEQARAMFREAADAFARAGNQRDAERCLVAAAG